tara:strand:- start:7845 stop:8048 length:204 start_codon:yes stop_codon:yes gene_type:complete
MPSHYGDKKSKSKSKSKMKMKPMTKEQHEMFLKAEKDGLITKKQHMSLPPQLLEAIIKSKKKTKKKK